MPPGFICCSSRPRARSRRLALAGLPLAMTPSTAAVGQGGRWRSSPGDATPDGMRRARKADLLAATGTASTALIRSESAGLYWRWARGSRCVAITRPGQHQQLAVLLKWLIDSQRSEGEHGATPRDRQVR